MKSYPHVLSKVYGEPWLITPEKHSAIRTVLSSRLGESAADLFRADDPYSPPPEPIRVRSTFIIPIHGIIGNRLSNFEMMCGGCNLDIVNAHLSVAASDSTIQRVILDIDSPGGTINGIPECGERIAALAEEKEVFAFTETMMCSGGYWLGSQASEVFCTGSARVGSIGVYSIFEDWSEWFKEEGIKVNAISAGEMKLAGAYFKPMSDKERAMFQARTDKIYKQFKEVVSSKRRKITDESMQGQVFDGEESALYGLVDATVDSIEDLIR